MAGFATLLIITAIVDPYLAPPSISGLLAIWFFALNLGAVIAIAFVLLAYFVRIPI